MSSINYCFNCGTKVDPTWNVCPSCGTALKQIPINLQPSQQPQSLQPQQSLQPLQLSQLSQPYKPISRNGKISLILGIVGIFIASIILGPLAIYFGIKGLKKDEKKGVARVGLILGIIDIILFIISLVLLLTIFSYL